MEEVHAAPAPPATGGSTAPRRKILVRRPKKARDTLTQTAEAESVKSLAAHATGPGSDVETLKSVGAVGATTRGSTPASSTAGAPTLVPTLKTTKRIDFDALRGGRETSGPGASTGRATPTSTKFGMATVAPPRTPPKPASEEAVAPNGPKVSGKTGKRDEWAVLGDVGEYEYMLARKMAEERAKLPPSPEVLPDLPSHIASESARLKGGAFDDHYKRAYRVLAERRAEFADAAATLRDGLDAAIDAEAKEDRKRVHSGWQLHVKMGETSHGNALAKWDAQKREWERVKRERAIAFNKRPGDLVMERCDEHRRKLEILGHLDMAVPISEREGGEPWLWKMSLRDNWTRWVNVGNEFSGLYYVRDEMAYVDVEQIRRPQLHGSVERDGASDSVIRGRSVLDSKFMDVRRRKLRRRVNDILPGENGEDIDVGLEIVGEGAVAALDRLAARRITLEELEEQIASDSLETWAEIQKYRSDVAVAEANRAARELAALQAEEAAREAAMGPHLHLESDRVMAQMRWGEKTAHATTTMRNTGTTAIWYRWSQVPPKAATLPHASNAGPSTFFMEETTGSLLPGESRVAMWTFKSEKPGVYIDEWILETTPNLRAGPREPVVVRGIYHADDPNSYPRRMLAAEIAHREMRTKVTAAMARVFDRVKTPDKFSDRRVATKFSPIPASGPAPALWNAGNAGRRPRVYYHEESFEAFMDVRRRCIAAEKTLPPEPTEEEGGGGDGEEGGGGDGEGGAEGAGEEAAATEETAAADDEPVVELPFEGWDGSVAEVEECIRRLEAAIDRKAALDAAAEAAAAEGAGEDADAVAAEDADAEDADAEDAAAEDADAGPPPEEVLASCRASFEEAMRVAILPRSRADLLAAALSEAVSNRLGSVDETFETARAKYRPPSPPPPEPQLDEEGNPIEPADGDVGADGAEDAEKKDKDAFDSVWRRKCRKVLTRSIGQMLGAAAEAFERDAVSEAETEVNTELIRRVRDMRVTAAKLETLGEEEEEGDRGSETQPPADGKPQSPGRAEWTEYELLRRRKALLGREVDPPGASRAPTPGSRSRTPA